MESLESIEECGITLDNPLKTDNSNIVNNTLCAEEGKCDQNSRSLSQQPSRSNSRLAVVAKAVGNSINILLMILF